ncbi:MAG TPA: MFS transporter [Candidatus Dormibacteraeota bacterium]|jgi:predicted MFS family arabinose efflux permease|nr:MFS transporter [Candidatus Dormibacteraeota bacterium]
MVTNLARSAGWELLRHRDFRLFWLARAISVAGDRVSWLALPTIAILVLGASPVEVGLLNAVQTLAWPIVGLLIGVWVDRLPRRRILIGSDAARALVLITIPAAFAFGHLTLPHLIIAAGIAGVFSVAFDLAANAHLPSMVRSADLAGANAVLEGAQQAVSVGAPGLGGLLISTIGAPFAVIADVLSYLLSGGLIARTRTMLASPPPARRRSLIAEAAEGVEVLLRDDALRRITVCAALSNIGLMMGLAIQLLFLYRVMHLSPAVVGVCFAAGSLASIVGALYNRRVMLRLGIYRTLLLSTFLEGLAYILIPGGLLLPIVPLLVGALLISGFFNTTWNVSVTTFRQQRVPLELMGRVAAAARVVGYGALPLGALLGGLLGQALTAQLGQRLGLAAGLTIAPLVAASSALALVRPWRD